MDVKKTAGMQVRRVALRLLGSVIDKKISLDGLTDSRSGQPAYLALEVRDRTLVRAITLATLRHYGTISAAIAQRLNRPLPQKAHSLHHLVSLTAAQILYLDVPDYASINLAVIIAKSDPRLRRFASLVNALSRQIARDREDILAAHHPHLNTPAWFADMVGAAYGPKKAAAILEFQALPPTLDITVKDKDKALEWAETVSGQLLPNGITVRLAASSQNLDQLPGFDTGDWWVQDVAASLPATLFGDLRGKLVADLCAAPGGKTAQLALSGGVVTAFDSSQNRMQRLIENMQRLALQVKTQIGDVRHLTPELQFDAVLCDAPCSSTGTVRRHPDILWTKSWADIDRLVQLQFELLETAWRFVRLGGVVVFSNCSLAPQEGEELIARFLQHQPQARISPIRAEELPQVFAGLVTGQGFLRSTPADLAEFGGMDGFFAARLTR